MRATRKLYRDQDRRVIPFQVDRAKIRRNGLALLGVSQQIHAEASATLFREIEPCFQVFDYVCHKTAMMATKPPPAIFYDETTDKPFEMPYTPNPQEFRCFSTFDPIYLARFRSISFRVVLGPQFNSPRDYNALQAAMRPFHAALIIENSTNRLP